MKLYDAFFKSLESTDNIDLAIKTVEKEILKRKTCLLAESTTVYDELKNKLAKMIKLKKKYNFLMQLKEINSHEK